MTPKRSALLVVFVVVMVLHWLEHLVQIGQVIDGVHRACASGLLGYFFPALVKGEWLHFGYALVMLVLFIVLTPMMLDGDGWSWMVNRSITWWLLATAAQAWHFFEHSLLFVQVQALHIAEPVSLLQLVFPRIELHLFYNTVVTALMFVSLYWRWRAQQPLQSGLSLPLSPRPKTTF